MSVWEYIIGAVLIVFSLVIIAIVLLQEGRCLLYTSDAADDLIV